MATATLHSASSCSIIALPCRPRPLSVCSSSSSSTSFPPRLQASKPLSFSSHLSLHLPFPTKGEGNWSLVAVEKPGTRRRSIVCEATPANKPDSAAKRARQAEKRRVYNKAKKSEVKTRMRKVFEALDVLKKKTEAQVEEILPIEKLIAEAYSAIDKAVKAGTLHRNTGAHRKSRLARRKKVLEIHHGWYKPEPVLAV